MVFSHDRHRMIEGNHVEFHVVHHKEVFALYANCKGDGIEPPVRVISGGFIVEDNVRFDLDKFYLCPDHPHQE